MTRSEVIECMARGLFVSGGAPLEYWDFQHEIVKNQRRKEASAALTALEAAGFRVVPGTPTEAMVEAGFMTGDSCEYGSPEDVYRAMLAAAKG